MKKRVEAAVVVVALCIVSLLSGGTSYAGKDSSTPGMASEKAEVLEIEKNWIKAFNTLDYDLMASLYRHSPETTSFSPNSGTLYQGWDTIAEGLKQYFSSPQGTYSWTLNDEQVTMLSDDMAIILGNHVVVDRPENGQEMTGTHVFTRVVQKIEGEWQIVHEHESHIPRKQS
jgi:uncharacterized protein (TIGR02246 family)